MDIIQLNYFINIVECGCNLSLAAKKVHVSQSALSQMVTNFERDESLKLFYRKNGRLEALTPSGKRMYDSALEIVESYDNMRNMIKNESSKQKGTIRVGMPSLILRVFFSKFFPNFIKENPDIKIEIVEEGCHDLRKKFLKGDLDYVVIIEPTNLDPRSVEEHVIQIDQYTAFMSPSHPLANESELTWKQIEGFEIATFNESFVTNDLVKRKLKDYNLDSSISFTSSSWDYLIEMTHYSETLTILPSPVNRYLSVENYIEKPFEDPIPFNVLLCRPVKSNYSNVEEILHESILGYFYQPIEN